MKGTDKGTPNWTFTIRLKQEKVSTLDMHDTHKLAAQWQPEIKIQHGSHGCGETMVPYDKSLFPFWRHCSTADRVHILPVCWRSALRSYYLSLCFLSLSQDGFVVSWASPLQVRCWGKINRRVTKRWLVLAVAKVQWHLPSTRQPRGSPAPSPK